MSTPTIPINSSLFLFLQLVLDEIYRDPHKLDVCDVNPRLFSNMTEFKKRGTQKEAEFVFANLMYQSQGGMCQSGCTIPVVLKVFTMLCPNKFRPDDPLVAMLVREKGAVGLDLAIGSCAYIYEKNMYQYITEHIIQPGICPNFLPFIAYGECTAAQTDQLDSTHTIPLVQNLNTLSRGILAKYPNHIPIGILVTPQIKHSTYQKFIHDATISNEDQLKVLFQILYAIQTLIKFKINHNDLHPDNVMIRDNIVEKESVYSIGDKYYYISCRYVPYIFDWDLSFKRSLGPNAALATNGALCEDYHICNKFNPFRDFYVIACSIVGSQGGVNDILRSFLYKFLPTDIYNKTAQIHYNNTQYKKLAEKGTRRGLTPLEQKALNGLKQSFEKEWITIPNYRRLRALPFNVDPSKPEDSTYKNSRNDFVTHGIFNLAGFEHHFGRTTTIISYNYTEKKGVGHIRLAPGYYCRPNFEVGEFHQPIDVISMMKGFELLSIPPTLPSHISHYHLNINFQNTLTITQNKAQVIRDYYETKYGRNSDYAFLYAQPRRFVYPPPLLPGLRTVGPPPGIRRGEEKDREIKRLLSPDRPPLLSPSPRSQDEKDRRERRERRERLERLESQLRDIRDVRTSRKRHADEIIYPNITSEPCAEDDLECHEELEDEEEKE